MKFYDCTTAPSPRRVRIFLAEKGISVPIVQVDLRNGEQFSPAFRAINPDCTVPVLELDNGTRIADIVAICRCFEELYPTPRLMGRTAEEKAVIDAWQRRIERDGFYAAMEVFRNSIPGLKGRALPGSESYDQIRALAERGRARIAHFFAWLDARIYLMIGKVPRAAFGNSTGDKQMLEYTTAGGGARLGMLVLHDDAQREYAYGPAHGLPDTKVGTFTQALYDEAKSKNWPVISMKNDWKRIFAFE